VEKSKANYTINQQAAKEARSRAAELLRRFPLYPEIDGQFLAEHFVAQEVAQVR
jgi:hypothetical protein